MEEGEKLKQESRANSGQGPAQDGKRLIFLVAPSPRVGNLESTFYSPRPLPPITNG